MTNFVFNFDPDKRKKYVYFWIYAIMTGISACFMGVLGLIAIMLSVIFALAAIVIPILMALDEKYNLKVQQIKNAGNRPPESQSAGR